MMRIINLFAFFTVSITVNAQSYNGPESIEYDPTGDRYFIANSNNGEIIARDNAGNLAVFASGLPSGPYGLEIVGNTLYACDGGRIKGFDLSTGSQTVNVNLAATFLNGITHAGTDLFITDFSAKKIYRMNTLNNAFNVYVTGLAKSPNGIIYDADDNRLVFVNWGTSAPIMAVNLADSTYSTLVTTSLGNIDGIAMNCSGQFYVASWSPTRISRFENDFIASPVDMGVTGLSSPADITYNTTEDTLAIPNSGNNTVKFVTYSDCLGTGISEIEKNEIELYPNPAETFVVFHSEQNESNIQISDITGKTILTLVGVHGQNQINISSLSEGIYLISDSVKTQKLIIRR